jgi:hypothetical protein
MGGCLNKCLFIPPRPRYLFDELPDGAEWVTSGGRGGARIPVLFIAAVPGADVNSCLTVLASHGNAEDLFLGIPTWRFFAQRCRCNVIA